MRSRARECFLVIRIPAGHQDYAKDSWIFDQGDASFRNAGCAVAISVETSGKLSLQGWLTVQ